MKIKERVAFYHRRHRVLVHKWTKLIRENTDLKIEIEKLKGVKINDRRI